MNAATITLITPVVTPHGGAVGAGGLGQIGYQYGYVGIQCRDEYGAGITCRSGLFTQLSGDRIVRAVTR